jgi:hypothetical protein
MESLANTQNGVNGESVQLPVERDWKRGYDAKYTTHKTKKMSNTDLIWQLRYKLITDNINLVIDDLFTFVFLRVLLKKCVSLKTNQ